MRYDVDDPNFIPFRILDHQLPATLYNTLKLGYLRHRHLHITIGSANAYKLTPQQHAIKNIQCYLFRDKWVCTDGVYDELPVAVWRDFNTRDRGIHEPVNCKVYVYHSMAGRIIGTILYAVEKYLDTRLCN